MAWRRGRDNWALRSIAEGRGKGDTRQPVPRFLPSSCHLHHSRPTVSSCMDLLGGPSGAAWSAYKAVSAKVTPNLKVQGSEEPTLTAASEWDCRDVSANHKSPGSRLWTHRELLVPSRCGMLVRRRSVLGALQVLCLLLGELLFQRVSLACASSADHLRRLSDPLQMDKMHPRNTILTSASPP